MEKKSNLNLKHIKVIKSGLNWKDYIDSEVCNRIIIRLIMILN